MTVPNAGWLPALLAPASAGDGEARHRLYQHYARVVHGIALARVGAQDADDVTQEAFATIYARLHTVRDAAALPGWIAAIARRRAADWLRRRRRRPPSATLDEVVDPSPPVESEMMAARILEVLRQLPDAYREPLVLRLVEGLSGPEIAERTGMTPASVRVNLCRGMARLRPLLRQEGFA